MSRSSLGRLAIFVAILVSSSAHSATIYTAKTGNDGNSCTQAQSESTPKLTIQAGITCLSSGDTLVVKAGVYAEENLGMPIPNGTSWENVTTIKTQPGDNVIIRPPNNGDTVNCFLLGNSYTTKAYIEFDGFECDGKWGPGSGVGNGINKGFVVFGGSHHLRLKNIEIHSTGGSGIGFFDPAGWPEGPGGHELLNLSVHDNGLDPGSGGAPYGHGIYFSHDNSKLWNNDVYDNTGYGFHIYSEHGDTDNNDIRYSRAWGNGWLTGNGRGILVDGSSNLIANNIVWGNHSGGIAIWNGSKNGNKIFNNTIVNNLGDAGIYFGTGSTNTQMINNIIYEPSISDTSGSGSGTQTANFHTDPLFTNPASNDYTLQPGSPAINAGNTLTEVTDDFAGTSRPQENAHDIGAFEYSNQSTSAATPLPPTFLGPQ